MENGKVGFYSNYQNQAKPNQTKSVHKPYMNVDVEMLRINSNFDENLKSRTENVNERTHTH